MGWGSGHNRQGRLVGYAIEATCDRDGCTTRIDRGLGYVCGGMHDGGDHGCGNYFCGDHLFFTGAGQLCRACIDSFFDGIDWDQIDDEIAELSDPVSRQYEHTLDVIAMLAEEAEVQLDDFPWNEVYPLLYRLRHQTTVGNEAVTKARFWFRELVRRVKSGDLVLTKENAMSEETTSSAPDTDDHPTDPTATENEQLGGGEDTSTADEIIANSENQPPQDTVPEGEELTDTSTEPSGTEGGDPADAVADTVDPGPDQPVTGMLEDGE